MGQSCPAPPTVTRRLGVAWQDRSVSQPHLTRSRFRGVAARPGADAARRRGAQHRARRPAQPAVDPVAADDGAAAAARSTAPASTSGCCATATSAGTTATSRTLPRRRTPAGPSTRCGRRTATCPSYSWATRWARGRRPRSPTTRRVHGVVGVAPWFPPGMPVDPLAGRHLVAAHGRADRVTNFGATREFVRRAQPVAASAEFVDMGDLDHYMVKGLRSWNRVARRPHHRAVRPTRGVIQTARQPACPVSRRRRYVLMKRNRSVSSRSAP